jgi:hypothetical protein
MRRLLVLLAAITVLGSMGAAIADDDVDGLDDDSTTTELNATQDLKARMLAEYFSERLGGGSGDGQDVAGDDGEVAGEDVTPADALFEEIVALRTGDDTVGWGALYKLLLIAEANETTLADVVQTYGEDGWGFGQIFKALREENAEWRGDTPRNLGQFKKQQREAAAEDSSSVARGKGKAKKNG